MLFLLAVMSGPRHGELFGLKWSDMLWETKQIQIQRTFNNGAWYKPKSKYSVRQYIQKKLGHSKPTVTLDICAHLMDENNPEATDRLQKSVWVAEWYQRRFKW